MNILKNKVLAKCGELAPVLAERIAGMEVEP